MSRTNYIDRLPQVLFPKGRNRELNPFVPFAPFVPGTLHSPPKIGFWNKCGLFVEWLFTRSGKTWKTQLEEARTKLMQAAYPAIQAIGALHSGSPLDHDLYTGDQQSRGHRAKTLLDCRSLFVFTPPYPTSSTQYPTPYPTHL
ncbi:MAG: hypothetical protein RL235_1197 [Chlamydiota bacterium]|jgi:hypothetical protein